jgi:hypothetical protein
MVRSVVVLPAPLAPIKRHDFTLFDVQRDAGQRFDGAVVYGNVF